MIYDNPGQQLDDMKDFFASDISYRMAIVSSITSTRPYIRFYGETNASQKPYKYLASYAPAVGDKVLVARIDKSYVILGKVV